jgi:hypothetical protein
VVDIVEQNEYNMSVGYKAGFTGPLPDENPYARDKTCVFA